MSVIPCKTTIAENSRAFGFHVGKRVPYTDVAWSKTQVKCGTYAMQSVSGHMIQHSPAYPVYGRKPSAGGWALWADKKFGRIISRPFTAHTDPFRHVSGSDWLYVDGNGERLVPAALNGIREDAFLIWDERTGEYILRDGDLCYIKWQSDMLYFWARNAAVKRVNGSLFFDFDNALCQWYRASPNGTIGWRPSKRPFVYPAGSQSRPSYLQNYTSDFPYYSQRSQSALSRITIGLNMPHWSINVLSPYVFLVPNPGVQLNPDFYADDGDGHIYNNVIKRTYVDDNYQSHDTIVGLNYPSESYVPRMAGTYIDWSTFPAYERALYWLPLESPSDVPDLTSVADLPKRLFGEYSSASRNALPGLGTAFDMTLEFNVYQYSVIAYRGHGDDPGDPPYYFDGIDYMSTGYFNTGVSGQILQIVPVPPKARAQGA